MKELHKQGVEAVRAGLINMSDQEENVGIDCLEHMFWGVLDYTFRNFSNLISLEESLARYMDPESLRFPGTRLGHMDKNWQITNH